ncbi:TPA: hypothetical protein ACS7XE_003450 [Providencia alcalifaciens]
MGLFNIHFIEHLKTIINNCERLTQMEFELKRISNENEYTYSLLSKIRDFVQLDKRLELFANTTLLTQTLPAKLERTYGTDACIILVDHDKKISKVCLFEAKLPRNKWDQKENKSGISHFSSQLNRQHLVSTKYAIWEQFYCYGHIQPNSLIDIAKNTNCNLKLPYKSLCLLHEDAYLHDQKKQPSVWGIRDIEQVVTIDSTFKPITMSGMVRHACYCKIGMPLQLKELFDSFRDFIYIPVVLLIEASEKTIDLQLSEKINKLYTMFNSDDNKPNQ